MNALLPARRRFDRRFYFGAALVALGLVFWGFAPTYYLKLIFGTPRLSTRLHIHGAVMSTWPHKRLLLLATACMMPSAFSRIPLNLTFMVSNSASILILFDLTVIVAVLIDTFRHRRLHRPSAGAV
jgi:hypothetical protein